jgi:hypothetical protein
VDTGQVLFSTPFGRRGPTVNAATPLVFDDYVFTTASYGVGAQLLQMQDAGQVRTVWANDTSLSSQYPTPVYHKGYLYGIHGREDVGTAALRCVEAKTGRVAWSQENFGMAHLIVTDDRLLIWAVDGRVILAEPTPERYRALASARISSAVTRALPGLSKGRLIFRENVGTGGTLKCVSLQ